MKRQTQSCLGGDSMLNQCIPSGQAFPLQRSIAIDHQQQQQQTKDTGFPA